MSDGRGTAATIAAALLTTVFGAVGANAGAIAAADLDSLPPADVTLLGEVHDNAAHHRNQARAIAAIRPAALVFEMITPERAARLPKDRSDAAALARALHWAESGWPDFALYAPIFAVAPHAVIYGGDVPEADVQRAVTAGAAAVFGHGAGRFGLTEPLGAADEAAREAELDAAHCHALPATLLPGMVEVQRLRDAALARAVLRAMAETGGPVVVIAGTGHVRRDRGVPAVLARAQPRLGVLSVGQIEGRPPADPPYDLWVATGAAPRGDPCAAFGTEARSGASGPETG